MFSLTFKRFIVSLMALVALFGSYRQEQWADSYETHEFPLIAAEAQAEGTTRIMSFNIRCADVNGVEVKDRLSLGVRQILEVMPDSLGLQEVTAEWMKELDKRLWMYGWAGIERDEGKDPKKGGESCPVFYLKAKYKLLDSGNFWLSDTPDVPSFGPGAACKRICTWVKLQERGTGRVYVHVNTHFDHVSKEARSAGAEIVTRFIAENFAGLPVVFTADMNARETEPVYAVMTAALPDARLKAADAMSFGTFHACSPETHTDSIIDYILCTDNCTVDAYRVLTKGVDGRFVSDHFPLYADLRIPKQNGRTFC